MQGGEGLAGLPVALTGYHGDLHPSAKPPIPNRLWGKRVVLFQEGGGQGGPGPTLWHTCGGAPAHVGRDHRPPLMALGAQEEEDRDESGCEEEEGREDEDEDSGSEESLVDSDSDPEEKGACACAGAGLRVTARPRAGRP